MPLSPHEAVDIAIGQLSIAAIFVVNRGLYGRGGVGTSTLEAVCYLVSVGALLVGWYFNFQYFRQYGDEAGWMHWTRLLFVNPASASGGQDLIIANLILFPLWTIVDGRRHRMRAAWWYFPMSLLTSYAFAIALFLALQDRQIRANRRG